MPTFMNKVLKVPITKTGIATIIPPLSQIFVKIGAGWICDKITIISVNYFFMLKIFKHLKLNLFRKKKLI